MKQSGPRQRFIWAAVLAGAAVFIVGSWWLVQRMAIGTGRHALNHQEWSKDVLVQDIRIGCSGLNAGKIWILKNDPQYVPDERATSNEVYRYMVLDVAVISAPMCLSAIAQAASRAQYPVAIALSNQGRQAAYFHFSGKGK